ncbi:MAG: hypothetical protein ABIY51_14400 [Ferruginibacter sp.]
MQADRKHILHRIISWVLSIAGIFLLLLMGLHIWFVNNARGQLIKIVKEKSHGKVSLQLRHLSYNFLSDDLEVKDARIFSTNKNDALAYNVRFTKLHLRVQSFWPLLFQRKLLLDSIRLQDPVIELVKNRNADKRSDSSLSDLSLPKEIGKIYNSMMDVFDDFRVRRIVVDNASFKLTNAVVPQAPVSISDIYLNISRNIAGSTNVHQEEAVNLVTTNQHIQLPGGRHKLSFKKFSLQLLDSRIELDSCTITAIPTNSTSSSYRIYFNKLFLVGVDFAAMYTKDVIKADSVYCEGPLFQVKLNTAMASAKKQRPDFDKIIKDLTGDLNLGFVGVKDAGIQVDLIGKKSRSLINSHKDNFQIKGLVIDADRDMPATIEEFNMLVRDYRLYSYDSSSVYGFDSLHFRNNKVVLNNFTVTGTKQSGNNKNFVIPHFELSGLDWYSLVFEQSLVADEAVMYSPSIRYTKNAQASKKNKRNLFSILASLDSLLTLQRIKIINGDVNVKLGKLGFQLHDVDLDINSNAFLGAASNKSMLSSVKQISFASADLASGQMHVSLKNSVYNKKDGLVSKELSITQGDKIKGVFKYVSLGDLVFNTDGQIKVIDRLQWTESSININPGGTGNVEGDGLLVRTVNGKNTEIYFENNGRFFKTEINRISFNTLTRLPGGKLYFDDLFVDGKSISYLDQATKASVSAYQVNQRTGSSFTGLILNHYSNADTIKIKTPHLELNTDINKLWENDIAINALRATSPDIYFLKRNNNISTSGNSRSINIHDIEFTNPSLNVFVYKKDSGMQLSIPAGRGSLLQAKDMKFNSFGFTGNEIKIKSVGYDFKGMDEQRLSAKNGEVNINLTKLSIPRDKTQPTIINLANASVTEPDTILLSNNSRLWIKDASLDNLFISTSMHQNLLEALRKNSGTIVHSSAGQLIIPGNKINWQHVQYDAAKKIFRADSILYSPLLNLEQTIAAQKFQEDYLHLSIDHIMINGFDLEGFRKDSSVTASEVQLDKPTIYIYRDRQKQYKEGIIKSLPATFLSTLYFPLFLTALTTNNGTVFYTERNAKTGAESTIKIGGINGTISNINSRSFETHDSLRMQLKGVIFDSSLIALKVSQSYHDSLGSMQLNIGLQRMNASILNPLIAPFAKVKLISGVVDSFLITTKANDYYAYGKMDMYYHNLKLQLVNAKDSLHQGIIRKIGSSLLNTFFIKTNANGRSGLVYFERLRDRSFFNYLIKISLSGLLTTTGAKSNKSVRKKYNHFLDGQKVLRGKTNF